MSEASGASQRHLTLDAVRGVAVMGILAANIASFGLPEAAYFSPAAWGGDRLTDRIAWFFNFTLVEGRMRGLFSFLFGASMLLVIDRAEAAGESGAGVHLRRMGWLFLFGCLHLYLFWTGDILAHYALVGAVALAFHRLSPRLLVVLALAMLLLSLVVAAGGAAAMFAAGARSTAAQIDTWNGFAYTFGTPPRAHLLAEIAAIGGSFADGVRWRWEHAGDPLTFALLVGPETLTAMLLGMAGYRSGFLTGAWSRAAYARIAATCLPISLLAYAALGAATWAHGFDQRWVYLGAIMVSIPFRVIGLVGYAALIVLLLRPGGALTTRIAAAGRMAFSNYLGTTLVMDLIFCGWGLGLYGQLHRATLYLLLPPVWIAMLVWSKWWLARFAYGPLEWLWRSLARGERQRFRRI